MCSSEVCAIYICTLNVPIPEPYIYIHNILYILCSTLYKSGTVVERVVSFKFLGKLNWSTHTDSIVKKAQQCLFNLRRLKKFGLSPKALCRAVSTPGTATAPPTTVRLSRG